MNYICADADHDHSTIFVQSPARKRRRKDAFYFLGFLAGDRACSRLGCFIGSTCSPCLCCSDVQWH